jgi:hypothetical protein
VATVAAISAANIPIGWQSRATANGIGSLLDAQTIGRQNLYGRAPFRAGVRRFFGRP